MLAIFTSRARWRSGLWHVLAGLGRPHSTELGRLRVSAVPHIYPPAVRQHHAASSPSMSIRPKHTSRAARLPLAEDGSGQSCLSCRANHRHLLGHMGTASHLSRVEPLQQ